MKNVVSINLLNAHNVTNLSQYDIANELPASAAYANKI
jgi:hypothetical protein